SPGVLLVGELLRWLRCALAQRVEALLLILQRPTTGKIIVRRLLGGYRRCGQGGDEQRADGSGAASTHRGEKATLGRRRSPGRCHGIVRACPVSSTQASAARRVLPPSLSARI